MKVKLIGKTRLVNLSLPRRIYGNYWITNEKNENLINIVAEENKWMLKSNSDIKIVDGPSIVDKIELKANKFYDFFDVNTTEKYQIFTSDTYDGHLLKLEFVEDEDLSFFIGNSTTAEDGKPNYISYEKYEIHYNQLLVERKSGLYYIKNLFPEVNMYINNRLSTEGYIRNGDVVFISGFTFSFVGNVLILSVIDNKIKYVTNKFVPHVNKKLDYSILNQLNDNSNEETDKKDYFIRPPRFNEKIENKDINVDSPPQKQVSENMPVILTLGPMLVMGMSSSVTGAVALIRVLNGEATWKDSFTSILTAGCMLASMLIFPSLSRAYQKHREKKKEKLRLNKYREYLEKVNKIINDECIRQKRILVENNVDFKNVGDIILYKKRNLWERKITHDDFLELRLGIGNVLPKINVKFPEEHFELVTDELIAEARKVVSLNRLILQNVPVTLSFREKYISSLIGKYSILKRYLDGLLLQLIAYHSYDELKIVILTNSENSSYWNKLKNTPYCWNNDKSFRYYATTLDEATRLSAELQEVFNERKALDKDLKNTGTIYNPYFLIITDDIPFSNKIGIVNDILKCGKQYGFGLLYLTDKLNSLPSECSSFISIEPNIGGVFENELKNKKQEFLPDFPTTTIDSYLYAISNISIETSSSNFELPSVYTFLEMYNAGSVEQLNSYNRWQQNDPTTSLSCPVGIDENGELFKIDLHEKVHGPHGLIAGMTGSGKSEFIISYILSMAVNYHPNEVQFVLIDYKGGGLAGAFENKETGEKLPHLAGTITNLDIHEIQRSLSSLQSELKRRQAIFNEARDLCNESTIDIYKYQKLYREGKVQEPVAHLFIISDEFAELKSQQPEFMQELISTARIGRSLGVHLILATQKPSGVVDEQIWSNSRFRVCLKVQDKSDSNDVIKSPDAVYLKETGRFFLQVGFNEFFAKGQSAWTGAPYFESDKRKKLIDTSVTFVNNIGEKIKEIDNDKNSQRGIHKGEEFSNILKYIEKIGHDENINTRQLWLDIIPAIIYVDKLKQKYNFQKNNFNLEPVIGEYDAPKEQRQSILTLRLTDQGNTLIFGMVGSGKENLISTIIYSLITTYTVEEVNIYILDFGSEMLRMYSKAPQVSGIVNSGQPDEIATLFRILLKKIEERKNLFADYNGNYKTYCAHSGKTVPQLIVFINGYESFNEMYPDYSDNLILLTREGPKYGIIFVISVSASNNIRMKLSQNFNEKLVLQMNDEFDYRQILGKTDAIPAKCIGRGIVKRENIYEFQTAVPADSGDLNPYIKETIQKLNEICKVKAEKLPSLPNVVTASYLSSKIDKLDSIPVGVVKETLEISTADISEPSFVITSIKSQNTAKFVSSLIYEIAFNEKNFVHIIDADKIIDQNIPKTKYYSSSFDKVLEGFKSKIDEINLAYEQSGYDDSILNNYGDIVLIITGISKLKTILMDKFESLVSQTMITSKRLAKIHYIIVDSIDNLKKLEYDNWYKDIVNSTRGIWIGNGLAEQNLFKLFGSSRSIPKNIPDNFGFNIVSGIPTLIKYVENYDTDEDML